MVADIKTIQLQNEIREFEVVYVLQVRWKVASKLAYGQNTIKADFSFCVSMCTAQRIEDKILEVLSSSEVNLPLVSLFPLA